MQDTVRGSSTTFKARFVDENSEPLVASVEVDSPTVQIKDPEGEVIHTAVGRRLGESGDYIVDWFVPEDLDLNAQEYPYTCEWYFTDLNDHTRSVELKFNVSDSVIPDLAEAQFTYLVRDGLRERILLSLNVEPSEISVIVKTSGFTDLYGSNCVADDNADAKEGTVIAERKIGHLVKDGLHYYWYMTEPLTIGEYVIFWDVREDEVSELESFQQTLRVPENNFWLFVKPLQLLLDKLKKKYITFQGYTTDQLYEFVIRGVGAVNGINPVTSWSLSTIPTREHMGIAEAVILAATKWALMSQQILEEELNFDHGGQTVTLGVRHDYSGIISMIDSLLDKFAESKLMIQRISCRVGTVGVRPYRYGFSNRVWKLGRMGSPQDNFYGISALMSMISS